MKIAVVSGGFDPIHVGHVQMIQEASKIGDVVVILNDDSWLEKKKGFFVSSWKDRRQVVEAVKGVSSVISGGDEDGSVTSTLRHLVETFPDRQVVFCNGGDRTQENIPEMSVKGASFLFGIGGGKAESSSEMAKRQGLLVQRLWGVYIDHYRDDHHVLKTLYVDPENFTSHQRHDHRGEFWRVLSGSGILYLDDKPYEAIPGKTLHVEVGKWHRIVNTSKTEKLAISEYQYGYCREDDIIRSTK